MHHPSRQPPPLRKAPLQESIATALGHPADMRGFGVMGTLLALAVAGFMVGGGVLMYRAAAQSSDVNSTLATAKIVTRGALTAFQTTGQLGALNTPAALAAHVFPRDALDSQGQPLDPWGGTWTLASPAVGTLPAGTAVVATVTQVPSSACVQMANQAAASNGFADVLVNGSSVLRQGQIDHAASGALCNAAPAVSVAFVATTAAQSTSGATMATPCIMPAPKTNTGTGTCPSGEVTPTGATTFPQTSTTTYSCATLTSPLGSTTSPWSPSVSGYCAPACVAPPSSLQTQSYPCPSGFTTSGGASTFTQSRSVSYTCPAPTGSPSKSYGTWSPTAASVCTTPVTTCTAPPSKTVTRSYNCPSGETVGGTSGGATSFTQSTTETYACSGSTLTHSYGTWSPSASTECAVPTTCTAPPSKTVTRSYNCPAGYTTSTNATSFTQSTTETYACSGSTLTHSYGTWSPTAASYCTKIIPPSISVSETSFCGGGPRTASCSSSSCSVRLVGAGDNFGTTTASASIAYKGSSSTLSTSCYVVGAAGRSCSNSTSATVGGKTFTLTAAGSNTNPFHSCYAGARVN